MCNANNFFCQTSGIKIRITGFFQKALETKKNKNMLETFLYEGKRATYGFFCVNQFQAIWNFYPPDPHEDFCPDPDPQKMRIRKTGKYRLYILYLWFNVAMQDSIGMEVVQSLKKTFYFNITKLLFKFR